ncbi:MAG TPA: hypothetical protein VNG12_25620 [Acidimicrobiales bacterium]|nr:hypothetical protein [Acidimicrobiales bacterium]
MLAQIEARTRPLVSGEWLIAVSFPLMGAWIAATVMDGADVFGDPFWCFLYMLVVGIGAFVWGIVTEPIKTPKRRGSKFFATVVLEEIALGVVFYLLFWALVGTGH